MKKIFVVLAILFIGILLAGCTSQPAATPVATTVPTPVPTTVVTTVPPTPVPTKEIVVVVVNKTATPTPTPTATSIPTFVITFSQDLTIIPGTSATIPVGGSVTWVNADPYKEHTVVAIDATDGAWFAGQSSATIPAGKSMVITFPKAGTYEYTTVYQPNMEGIIRVK